MQSLRVSLVQTELAWHDPAANRAALGERLDGLRGATDLVVLPEMFSTGFTMRPEDCAEPHDGASVDWMLEQAHRLDAVVTGSLAVHERGAYFNRLHWATPDGTLLTYDKRHLFRMAGEHNHYAAGSRRLVARVGDWRVCPLICYDLRFPVWSRSLDDYDLLVFVANWPAARRSSWTRLLRARAVENLCPVVGVNRVGEDGNGVRYVGESLACDWLGDTLHDCEDRVEVATVRLDGAGLVRYRDKFPAHLDADRFRLED